MTWQQILAGLCVIGACLYLLQRFRRRSPRFRSDAPDVPVSRLTHNKRGGRSSCGH